MSNQLARLTAAFADRYRIDRELGAGGMATVYLAEDLKHNRMVAVKVLKPELAVAIAGKGRTGGALLRTRGSEPGGQRVGERRLGYVSHPGHISVGPNQHGAGRSDRTECRKLPCTIVFRVD